jgi:hypothetical protein
MASPVSNLSLRDNLIANSLDEREFAAMVYSSDFGYNKIQQLIDIMNPFGAVSVENPKFEVAKLGNLSIAQTIGIASTLTGTNLLVTFSQPNSNFRVKDIVYDSNLIGGRVAQVVSSTQIILEPYTNTTWTVGTQFTAGMTAKVGFDASGNLGSRGKTSLTFSPETTYNYTGISRDTTVQYRRDRIKTYVKWKGKNWYTSQQELMMTAFSKMLEFKYMFSERKAGSGVEGDYNTTGGVRWNIINNGGKYFPISNNLTKASFDDILYQFSMTVANNSRKVVALMGKQAMFNIQTNITADPIKFAGDRNTFGGMNVMGWDVMKYGIGGMEIDFVNYPLFDDPTLFPELSTITGQPKMSSSILLIDTSPVEAVDGSGMVPPIQKRYFGDKEFYHNFLPGMIGPNGPDASSIKSGDAILSVSDIDGVEMEILCDDGLYIIPERMALIELAS